MPRYALREATLDDVPLLVRHRRRMWEDMQEGFTPHELDEADRVYRRWVRARLANGKLAAYVAETTKGEPVASGCVWLQTIHPRPRAPTTQPYILSMYTEPEHRGRGLAARVAKALVAWAKERGYPSASLHAAPMGRGVYETLGFERTWEMRKRPL